MIEIQRTPRFDAWLLNLRDPIDHARIAKRIDRLALGNPGQWRSVGEGVLELKISYGPGYRVYYVGRGTIVVYVGRGTIVVLLLCGGDKRTQEVA